MLPPPSTSRTLPECFQKALADLTGKIKLLTPHNPQSSSVKESSAKLANRTIGQVDVQDHNSIKDFELNEANEKIKQLEEEIRSLVKKLDDEEEIKVRMEANKTAEPNLQSQIIQLESRLEFLGIIGMDSAIELKVCFLRACYYGGVCMSCLTPIYIWTVLAVFGFFKQFQGSFKRSSLFLIDLKAEI